MHKLKISHRDLKLMNVVIFKKNIEENKNLMTIKLIDFGSAFKYENSTENIFPDGTIWYYPKYIDYYEEKFYE